MHPVINKNEPELSTDNLPPVFNRAQSAKETLVMHRSQGKMTSIDERESRLSQLTVQNLVEKQKQQHHQGVSVTTTTTTKQTQKKKKQDAPTTRRNSDGSLDFERIVNGYSIQGTNVA